MAKYEIDDKVVDIIIQMCDLSLRSGGLKNRPAVDMVLSTFKSYIELKAKEQLTKEEKDKGKESKSVK